MAVWQIIFAWDDTLYEFVIIGRSCKNDSRYGKYEGYFFGVGEKLTNEVEQIVSHYESATFLVVLLAQFDTALLIMPY